MKLRWTSSLSSTSLHAAACFWEGLPLADPNLASELAPAIEKFLNEFETCRLSVSELLPVLVGLASEVGANRQLVDRAATRLWGQGATNETSLHQLAGAISDLETSLLRARPQLEEELAVRGRPLREQWEGRGPGLLRQMAQLSDELLLAPAAEIVLVAPLAGGHGRAHQRSNRLTFEAVLTNPHPELPETLRMGWLLAQLNLDLPVFADNFSTHRLPIISQLATVPLALAAAERVELIELSPLSISQALKCWHLPSGLPADLDRLLSNWWETYTCGKSNWAVALTALDAMLSDAMSDQDR